MDDEMKVSVLTSGSTGNATYIETPQHKILLDAGLSCKNLTELMNSIDRDISEVDTLLVSHEHSDHRQSVGVLARKFDLNVYANQKTWDAMGTRIGNVPMEKKNLFAPNSVMSFGDIDIESFSVSHDAADPQFYAFHHAGKTFVVLTDSGYVSERIKGVTKDADAYLMESNHDMEMLRNGSYSWSLKQRILGNRGHLSNEDSAEAMTDLIGSHTKNIFLGHRSRQNNLKSLAHLTVASILKDNDLGVGHDFNLMDTDAKTASDLIII